MTLQDFASQYGLFVAQTLTIILLIVLIGGFILVVSRRSGHEEGGIVVEKLNEKFEDVKQAVNSVLLDRKAARQSKKDREKQSKAAKQENVDRPRIYVLDFKGDLRASATASLREEISAVLAVARDQDSVLIRLENPGGAVHEHGLAASQLARLRANNIRLEICVDKVAASGGYLMACVADKIIAAPFAIVGSIGVLLQLPNVHRLLESKGVDFEQLTAGKYKRTLTVFGENTEEGREKMRAELSEIHELFKASISEHRPIVDIESVATGEHWYGTQALKLNLIDEIRTSDDVLREAAKDADLYRISFQRKKALIERLTSNVESLLMLRG